MDATSQIDEIINNIELVLWGKREEIRLCLVALLSNGHLLIEDVPGVGKTMLAKALARSVGCTYSRIQFTPDLLPSDITGVKAYNQKNMEFEFIPGPVFAQIVLADEINRATPKAQAALLEAMEEKQVTVEGTTYRLPEPFMVIATQNPVEHAGTYSLPEAQLDRFMLRMQLGYLSSDKEVELLTYDGERPEVDDLQPVISSARLRELQLNTSQVYVSRQIREYIVSIVNATRDHPQVALGVSTRGAQHLMKAAQAYAFCNGRDFVMPDDVKALAKPVMAHRILLKRFTPQRTRAAADVVDEVLQAVKVPED